MYGKLFESCHIGKLKIKNRLVMAPMGNLADIDGGFSRRQIDYFTERAKGGAGLIISGSLLFTSKFGGSFAGVFENINHVGRAAELADSVHRYGAKLAFQFNLGGGRCGGMISASAVPTVANSNVLCRALEPEEIQFIITQCGKSALLAKNAGIDAIMLHAYAGYLLDQFQSAEWNHRTDAYGGSLENRMRLTCELIQSIKKTCGADYPVIIKFSVDHGTQTGRKLPEGLEMCKIIEDAGADAIQVDAGSFETKWHRCIPTVYEPEAYSLDVAAKVKQTVDITVLAQNKLDDPATAEAAIAAGKCDCIAMGHALLADPYWPTKVKSGQIDDIRPCIGCNECLLCVNTGKYFHCSVNPYLSHEQDCTYEISTCCEHKNVLVIGGGPGGMAAALGAAKAGHTVTLWEKNCALGGNMLAAGAPSFKKDVMRYVQYLRNQIEKTDINVVLNKEATAENMLACGFDRVILASGANPKNLSVPIAAGTNVMFSLDVLNNRVSVGDRVVVIGGGLIGCELACSVAETASEVTILEFQPALLMTVEEARNNAIALRTLIKSKGVKSVCGAAVTSIEKTAVYYTMNGKEQAIACDTVVLALGLESNNALAAALEQKGIAVTTIGDAQFPRKIGNAVKEGLFAIIDMA